MAKKMRKRLRDLGGALYVPVGLGDEQAPKGHFEALIPWMESVFIKLSLGSRRTDLKEIPFKFSFLPGDTAENHVGYSSDRLFELEVDRVQRQTSADHFQTVLKIDFSFLSNSYASKPSYSPGDIVEIFSLNRPGDIEEIIDLFGWREFSSKPIKLVASRSDANFPDYLDPANLCITFREFLTRHLLISDSTPNQRFFGFLSLFLEPFLPPLYLEKLQELGDLFRADSVEAYQDYCWRPRRRILEILRDFLRHPDNPVEVSLPPEICFDLFSWNKPRPFSISSFLKNENLSITAALVDFPSPLLKTRRQGFFSATLNSLAASLAPLDARPMYFARIYKGSMFLPSTLVGPLVFACAGTGIAPMISFLQSLCHEKTEGNLNPSVPIVLLFGYRYEAKDFLHRDDLTEIQRILADQFTFIHAGSRDFGGQKKYIDDLIIENQDLFVTLLSQPTSYFYLCGNTKLPGRMKDVFMNLGLDYNLMESQGRFQVETW